MASLVSSSMGGGGGGGGDRSDRSGSGLTSLLLRVPELAACWRLSPLLDFCVSLSSRSGAEAEANGKKSQLLRASCCRTWCSEGDMPAVTVTSGCGGVQLPLPRERRLAGFSGLKTAHDDTTNTRQTISNLAGLERQRQFKFDYRSPSVVHHHHGHGKLHCFGATRSSHATCALGYFGMRPRGEAWPEPMRATPVWSGTNNEAQVVTYYRTVL